LPVGRYRLLHHLDREPGQLVGGDVLGRCGGLAGDELEVVTWRNVDRAGADALKAAIALVALLGRAEEQAAVPVDPDVSVAGTAKVQSMLPLSRAV
jgi:hypothetical protein